jgi:hypothetical protein
MTEKEQRQQLLKRIKERHKQYVIGWVIICCCTSFFWASIAFGIGYMIRRPSFESCIKYYDNCKIKRTEMNKYKFKCEDI